MALDQKSWQDRLAFFLISSIKKLIKYLVKTTLLLYRA